MAKLALQDRVFPTVMDWHVVHVIPDASTTVRQTWYVPGLEYWCVGVDKFEVVPSPNDHAHETLLVPEAEKK